MKITYLNGKRLSRAIKAASQWVVSQQQKLNEINVFPVPDSDTGTNMASTMRSIAESVEKETDESIEMVSKRIADSALNGARGNSGAILAQFFYGLAEGVKGKARITTQHFSEAVHQAVERSYEALANPKEGTILTVIREWAEHVREKAKMTHDFSELMNSSLKAARRSLEETPKKLKKLAKAGVVDAGGLGFVYMIEGITDFIVNGKIRELQKVSFSKSYETATARVDYETEQITYRYCTEFFLRGREIPLAKLRKELGKYGDSLIVAGSPERVRIHIHTDDPRKVFDFVLPYGEILDQKVDDMHQQHRDAHEQTRQKEIALVTDSSCDLPPELLQKYNIHMVPLRLYLGETEYIDKVTIQPEEFYERFTGSTSSPKTSQPTPRDFLRTFEQLVRHYKTIVALQLSSGLSGTYQSALTAARQLPDHDIRVIDTRTLSVALGLIVQCAAEEIAKGVDVESLIRKISSWIQNNQIVVSIRTLEYLVKGGRVSKSKSIVANLLGRVPILTVNREGKAEKLTTAKAGLPSQKKVLDIVLNKARKMKKPRFAIVHVAAEETAVWYKENLLKFFPDEEIHILPVAPVLGAHAGPGAAAVAVLDQEV